jgi:hypothetical protein
VSRGRGRRERATKLKDLIIDKEVGVEEELAATAAGEIFENEKDIQPCWDWIWLRRRPTGRTAFSDSRHCR